MQRKSRSKRVNRGIKGSSSPRLVVITAIVTGVLGLFAVLFVVSFFRQVTVESAPALARQVVRVQVLNGCGTKGLAEKTGEVIRGIVGEEIAFDVVEVKNAPIFGFDRTLVVSRRRNGNAASIIADRLNLDNPVLTERLARNPLEIDVTVVIGSDIEELEI